MRYVAKVTEHPVVKRLMIYEYSQGTYLFIYDIEEDGPCSWDQWFETLDETMKRAEEEYGVRPGSWDVIPDPPERCQQDWIAHVRVLGGGGGRHGSGEFEMLVDGQWVSVSN